MPLDTTTYPLALLRLDGRRWNELRRLHATLGPNAAADGSAYLELGHTKVLCTVSGPAELRRAAGASAPTGGGGGGNAVGAGIAGLGGAGAGAASDDRANVVVEVHLAGFSAVDRRRRGRGDK